MSELPTYVLERVFDAPRELVWKTWADPALLPRWYGPRVETIIHRLELKPGGLCSSKCNGAAIPTINGLSTPK
jgi:uncharacterized protein YndB with AHSA1/START domain